MRMQPPATTSARCNCVQEECGRVYARRGRSSTRQPRRYSQSTVSTRKHHGTVTGPRCSANFAFVAAEHDGSLDVICKRGSRPIAEHGLEHGEDALGRRRGGREGEGDSCCLGPARRRKLAAVDLPPVEHTLGEDVVPCTRSSSSR